MVCYILAIEKEHEVDINVTDALWGETGISFLIFSPIRAAHLRRGCFFLFLVVFLLFSAY